MYCYFSFSFSNSTLYIYMPHMEKGMGHHYTNRYLYDIAFQIHILQYEFGLPFAYCYNSFYYSGKTFHTIF